MATCEYCDADLTVPRECSYCGHTYCSKHRLPERHDCPGVENWERSGKRFDSGFGSDE